MSTGAPPSGCARRNLLNLTLPASALKPAEEATGAPISNVTPETVVPGGSAGSGNTLQENGDPAASSNPVQLRSSVETSKASAGAPSQQQHQPHLRRPIPPPLTNVPQSVGRGVCSRHSGNESERSNGYSNRISTAPVDVAEVLRRLEAQDLDAIQRQQLSEFVAEKQKIGELRPEDFEKLSELGKGNGGVVSRVRHIGAGLIMAKKNIHLEVKAAEKSQIIRELQVLHDCNSPYIVGYYGAFFADGDISICMEYMDGGSLDVVLRHAGRLPEPVVAKILYSVLKCLVYLREELHIIHRDVKPSNILVKRNGDVKLCDFGVSGQLIDSMANSFVGTRSYMAPERLNGEQYNISSDVWSVGLALVELSTGRYPIPAIEKEEIYLSVFSKNREENLKQHERAAIEGTPLKAVTGQVDSPMSIFELLCHIVEHPPPNLPRFGFSDDFLDVVDSCLQRVPSDRPSLDSLLQHPFVVTVAGCCAPGAAHRQSTISPEFELKDNESADPINLGRYFSAILPPLSVDELQH